MENPAATPPTSGDLQDAPATGPGEDDRIQQQFAGRGKRLRAQGFGNDRHLARYCPAKAA